MPLACRTQGSPPWIRSHVGQAELKSRGIAEQCPKVRASRQVLTAAASPGRIQTKEPLRVAFDRRMKLEFHGARITSDGGLLAYRELDDALDLTATAASTLAEGRHGKNIRHRLLGLLRQAVYGRLAGYEDVNDAARLARDPGMGERGTGGARSTCGLDQRDGPVRDRLAGH